MELKEIQATLQSPYRCYVRGKTDQTEGENVHTIGFKDGIAVVQMVQDNVRNVADNKFDSKSIDLTKLKRIIVKTDPTTGKKYILKDGKRIDILPQFTSPIISLKPTDKTVQINMPRVTQPPPKKNFTIRTVPAINGGVQPPPPPPTDRGVIVKQGLVQPGLIQPGLHFSNLNLLPKLIPTNSNVKVLDNIKYHVVQMNMKKPSVDRDQQTDSVERREVCTQTDPLLCGDACEIPFSEQFFNFILDNDNECDGAMPKKMIDTSKLKTKQEIHKFNFFNDMRNALNFDKTGNLPIHNSVMQNNLKAVQKNCIILHAIKESVNIPNQQCYAPLHLAILYDVNLEIIRVLLRHNADVRIQDPEGNTPLHLAIEHRHSAMLKLFVNTAVRLKFNIDMFNYEGFTPLIMTCLSHSYEDAKFLLQNGANPNERDMKSGRTALFHSAEGHDVNLVELLMRYKADTKIRNFFGTSPHDAMFELEEIPFKIKFLILGRDHQRIQNKKKLENLKDLPGAKKAKLTTTPVLRKVSSSELIGRQKK